MNFYLRILNKLIQLQSTILSIKCKLDTLTLPYYGIVTSPPVDAPTGNDPIIVLDITTGILYYWDGDSWEVSGSAGATPLYYELVATYSTDGTSGAHTFTVIDNTFPATTWTAENMPSGAIILHPTVLDYADYANNAKMILVGGSTYNLLGYSVYCGAISGSSPATDGLQIIPINGGTGAAATTSDLDVGLMYQPLPIIIRYYY